jgi:toxin ParE1/3/4
VARTARTPLNAIEWSTHALSDLQSISEYIEQDRSLETANRVTRTMYDAVQSLLTMPYRGRHGRIEGVRELVVSRLPYIVVYQVFEERLLVLSIVHGAQKWP